MGSPVASFVRRDVVGKRWIRCGVWQTAISSFLWLGWEFFFLKLLAPHSAPSSFPLVWGAIRYFLFQTAQICFLVGQTFISEPEESEVASPGDLASELGFRVWRFLGPQRREVTWSDVSRIRSAKVGTTASYSLFALLSVVSGVLAVVSLFSSLLYVGGPCFLDLVLRGVTVGLMYAAVQFYQGRLSLSFPIIQRQLYFSFKIGIPEAVSTSCLLGLGWLPLGEFSSLVLIPAVQDKSALEGHRSAFWWLPVFAAGIFLISLCWEVSHHLVQVMQTKLYEFAPPLGSPSAERNPTEMLLMVLEDKETSSLIQYLAFLDLCYVSETNVDTWRRAAIFEETGDTYRRSINVCLKRLDDLTTILAQGLESIDSDKGMDFFRTQIVPADGDKSKFQLGVLSSPCKGFQLCALTAKTMANLSTRSQSEDKYGVAQLNFCNVAVVSSLLSCLLVLEVYLGRRSSLSGSNSGSFVPNSVKWTVPSRGAFMEPEKRKYLLFGKRTLLQKNAYVLADVVRTSVYQIVYAFSDEIGPVGPDEKGHLEAVRDWISPNKPLYGTQDIHLQKLIAFLPYQVR